MAGLRVTEADAIQWVAVGEAARPAERAKLSPGERASEARVHHPGGKDELQMFEIRVGPDEDFHAHAHLEDEVIYVLEGELHLGRRALRVGSSIYVPGGTLYAFRSGPDGLRFLNFRARQDLTYLTKDEYMAQRAAARFS